MNKRLLWGVLSMVLVLPLSITACKMIPSNNIATVESISYQAQAWGNTGLRVDVKPSNGAKALVIYTVDLYESGRYRASEYVGWADDQLRTFLTIPLYFNIPEDEVEQYMLAGKQLTDVFSVKIYEQGITLISPNGGEDWHIGDVETITWKSTNLDKGTQILIELRSAEGLLEQAKTENTGSYKWTVRESATNHARVKITTMPISDRAGVFNSTSADDFTISAR